MKNDALIEALQSVCRATNTPAELTRKIVRAATGETETPDKSITTKQAASRLEVHDKTILRWGREGKLKAIRQSPRRIRWRMSEVERLAMQGVA